MTSPEQNRVGGARPSGPGGVRNLLAMFEKSSSSPSGSPAPTGPNPVNPAVHEQSPGPRPLGRVRTSFVAVQANSNPILGLQKAPSPSSPMSPVVSVSDGGRLFGGPLESASEKELGETAQKQPLDEANLRKHDLETRNGYTAPSFSPPIGTALPPSLEDASAKQVEVIPEKPLDSIPTEKDVEEPAKPVKAEPKPKPKPKPKPVVPKAAPAPKSPTKSMFTSNKVAPTTKSGKNLTLPPSKSTTTSPLPSPALPKSPVRSAASSSGSGSRAKPSAAAQGTGSSSARTRTSAPTSTTATSVPTAPKPRQTTAAIEKTKVPTAKKTETKVVREPSKPPTIRSSAFTPTTAPAAKLAAEQKVAAARSRPPSSASVRNRSPPSSSGMRRGNSGMGSGPGRKDQRSPQRPQTSAAIRNPNRTSVGSVAAVPGASGGDFLSRMMRPTTSSAGKSSDKKPGPMNPPPKRPASVASTSRRREKSLPPTTGRLHKQITGEGPKLEEKASIEVAEQSVETPAQSDETHNQTQDAVNSGGEITGVVLTEISVEAEVQESEDGCQSPTTTTSSTTLVHEGEGKEDHEILAKE